MPGPPAPAARPPPTARRRSAAQACPAARTWPVPGRAAVAVPADPLAPTNPPGRPVPPSPAARTAAGRPGPAGRHPTREPGRPARAARAACARPWSSAPRFPGRTPPTREPRGKPPGRARPAAGPTSGPPREPAHRRHVPGWRRRAGWTGRRTAAGAAQWARCGRGDGWGSAAAPRQQDLGPGQRPRAPRRPGAGQPAGGRPRSTTVGLTTAGPTTPRSAAGAQRAAASGCPCRPRARWSQARSRGSAAGAKGRSATRPTRWAPTIARSRPWLRRPPWRLPPSRPFPVPRRGHSRGHSQRRSSPSLTESSAHYSSRQLRQGSCRPLRAVRAGVRGRRPAIAPPTGPGAAAPGIRGEAAGARPDLRRYAAPPATSPPPSRQWWGIPHH